MAWDWDEFRKKARAAQTLKRIGYWKTMLGMTASSEDTALDPKDFIDPSWSYRETKRVVQYLQDEKFLHNQFKGSSLCRICGKSNGSADMSDGTYLWPDGLVHYVEVHGVKPPQDFIDHALSQRSER